MEVTLVQITLGIILFFTINWIGKHSYSIGYIEISIFAKNEEAPALNFLIRVLTPVIFLILVSTGFYTLRMDRYVHNIYLVNIYYIVFRLVFNVMTNRGLLINWYRQVLYWIAIILLSVITYEKIIKVKSNILPDFTTIANELWIIILVFLFQLANNININQSLSQERKIVYIKARYNYFKAKYGETIKEITNNEVLEIIAYSILIYEDFNRPKIARLVENLRFRITKKPHTLGVMQVRSNRMITDKESVILGTKKIVLAFQNFWEKNKEDEEGFDDFWISSQIISNYNGGHSYTSEINRLMSQIRESFYENITDTLQFTAANDEKVTRI